MFKGLGLEKDALKVGKLLKWTAGIGVGLTGGGLLANKLMKKKGPAAPPAAKADTSGSTWGNTPVDEGQLK